MVENPVEKIERALKTGAVIQIVGDSESAVDSLVSQVANGREIENVECHTLDVDNLNDARKRDNRIVHYQGFGALAHGDQSTVAQRIKAQFERGVSVVVSVSEEHHGALTLANGDLTGRVYTTEVISDG